MEQDFKGIIFIRWGLSHQGFFLKFHLNQQTTNEIFLSKYNIPGPLVASVGNQFAQTKGQMGHEQV